MEDIPLFLLTWSTGGREVTLLVLPQTSSEEVTVHTLGIQRGIPLSIRLSIPIQGDPS